MYLPQLYENLYYGELSNLLMDNVTPGELPAEMRRRVMSYLNQSLTAIYTRVVLLEKEVVIEAQDEVYLYYLQSKYAVNDPTIMPMKYIRDTPDDPFTQDVIRISEVYNEIGERLSINDPTDELSLYTPKFDALQIPQPVTGAMYTVLYQAKHPKITLANVDDNAEIMVPAYLEIALRHHIAALYYGSMNGPEHLARSMDYMTRYENAISETDVKDLARTSMPVMIQKFEERGFI